MAEHPKKLKTRRLQAQIRRDRNSDRDGDALGIAPHRQESYLVAAGTGSASVQLRVFELPKLTPPCRPSHVNLNARPGAGCSESRTSPGRLLQAFTLNAMPSPATSAVLTSALLDRLLHHAETVRIEGKSYAFESADPRPRDRHLSRKTRAAVGNPPGSKEVNLAVSIHGRPLLPSTHSMTARR